MYPAIRAEVLAVSSSESRRGDVLRGVGPAPSVASAIAAVLGIVGPVLADEEVVIRRPAQRKSIGCQPLRPVGPPLLDRNESSPGPPIGGHRGTSSSREGTQRLKAAHMTAHCTIQRGRAMMKRAEPPSFHGAESVSNSDRAAVIGTYRGMQASSREKNSVAMSEATISGTNCKLEYVHCSNE